MEIGCNIKENRTIAGVTQGPLFYCENTHNVHRACFDINPDSANLTNMIGNYQVEGD